MRTALVVRVSDSGNSPIDVCPARAGDKYPERLDFLPPGTKGEGFREGLEGDCPGAQTGAETGKGEVFREVLLRF